MWMDKYPKETPPVYYGSIKKGLFKCIIESDLPGWHYEKRVLDISGETNCCYVYGKYRSYTNEDCPLSIHKDRLIGWLPLQQTLFDYD